MELEVFFEENLKVNAKIGNQIVKTDQPVRAGGDGTAPAPFDLFLASLGTCAGIYVKGFCQQRGIPTDDIKIIQKHQWNPVTRLIDKIDMKVILPEDFPEKYKPIVLKAVDQCAVKKHLASPPEFAVSTT